MIVSFIFLATFCRETANLPALCSQIIKIFIMQPLPSMQYNNLVLKHNIFILPYYLMLYVAV